MADLDAALALARAPAAYVSRAMLRYELENVAGARADAEQAARLGPGVGVPSSTCSSEIPSRGRERARLVPKLLTEVVIPNTLLLETWRAQEARWPKQGRHILGQFDDEKVVVYQAYNPAIADFAARHRRLAGAPGFGLRRMSWVKPNFLWMMYRSGWARKAGEERGLAIHLGRTSFERLLAIAAWTRFEPAVHDSEETWRAELARSPVRLQWDPDHTPGGNPVARRAIQLGLSGDVLSEFASTAIRDIEDVTPFVHAQDVARRSGLDALMTTQERVYPVMNRDVARRLLLEER